MGFSQVRTARGLFVSVMSSSRLYLVDEVGEFCPNTTDGFTASDSVRASRLDGVRILDLAVLSVEINVSPEAGGGIRYANSPHHLPVTVAPEKSLLLNRRT